MGKVIRLGRRASRPMKPMGVVDRGAFEPQGGTVTVQVSEAITEVVEPGHTSCSKCGRRLTNPTSVAIGIGPVCGVENLGRYQSKALEAHGQMVMFPDTDDVVLQRTSDGTATANIDHMWKLHSPTGFEWGCAGIGPADLALNVLLRFGLNRQQADLLHQDFKRDFIVGIPRSGGTISATSIRKWIAEHKEADMGCTGYKKTTKGKKKAKAKKKTKKKTRAKR